MIYSTQSTSARYVNTSFISTLSPIAFLILNLELALNIEAAGYCQAMAIRFKMIYIINNFSICYIHIGAFLYAMKNLQLTYKSINTCSPPHKNILLV